MSWIDEIGDVLSRYTGVGGGAASAPADPHQDYCKIAQSAPTEVIASALANAFRSDQTPSFPQMVSGLFGQSNPEQRAGLLNRLLATVGPAALAGIPQLRPFVRSSGGTQSVTAEAASRVSPEQVQQLADHAQRTNPGIVDQASSFFAQHPEVVKALGGAAIAIAIQHIARQK